MDLSDDSQAVKKPDEEDEFIDREQVRLNRELTFGTTKDNKIDQDFLLQHLNLVEEAQE